MKLSIYNGEFYQRSKRWYLAFWLVVLGIVVLSIIYDNIFGAVLVLVLVWGYLYIQTKIGIETTMEIKDEGIQVLDRLFLYGELQGFVLEIEKKSWKLINIVLVKTKGAEAFTLRATSEELQSFCLVLQERIPQLQSYQVWLLDNLFRKLKI